MNLNRNSSTYETILFHLSETNPYDEFTKDALADDVYFDRTSRRYKYKDTNQFASREAVIKLQEKFLARKEQEFIKLTSRIKAGEVGVYKELSQTLKQIHISNAIIERGGIDRLTSSDLGIIGNLLKKQYYSGKDEETGKPYGLKYLLRDAPGLSEAQLSQRLKLYVESGKITASILARNEAVSNGLIYAQRFLNPAEHCQDCIYYASLGRQLIEFLPVPKTRCKCRNNCKCTIRYYASLTE